MLDWAYLLILFVILYFLGRILEVLIQIRDGKAGKSADLNPAMGLLQNLLGNLPKPIPIKFYVTNSTGTLITIHLANAPQDIGKIINLMKADSILFGSETYVSDETNYPKDEVERLLKKPISIPVRTSYLKVESKSSGICDVFFINDHDTALTKYNELLEHDSTLKGEFIDQGGMKINLLQDMDDDLRDAIAVVSKAAAK